MSRQGADPRLAALLAERPEVARAVEDLHEARAAFDGELQHWRRRAAFLNGALTIARLLWRLRGRRGALSLLRDLLG